jgi:hypothetical protein
MFKSANQYLLYNLINSNNAPFDLTNLLSTKNSSTTWKISEDCSKFYASPDMYSLNSVNYTPVINLSGQTLLGSDATLTYSLASGKILKYISGNNSIITVYSNPNNSYAGSVIRSYSNRIIVYTIASNNIVFEVYVDNNNTLTPISRQSFTFTSPPSISISS